MSIFPTWFFKIQVSTDQQAERLPKISPRRAELEIFLKKWKILLKQYTVQSYMKHRFWQEFLLSDRNCTTSLFTATSRILSWGTLHYGRNSKLLSENYETFFILKIETLFEDKYKLQLSLSSLQRTKNKRMYLCWITLI